MNTGTPTSVRRVSRAAALLVGPAVLVVVAASPALAVPEGWSDPGPVSGLRALLVYVIAPLATMAAVTLLVLLPSLVSRAKAVPAITDPQDTGPQHPDAEALAIEPPAATEHTSLDELLGAPEADRPA